MRRSEFLVSLVALAIVPFLPRQKLIRMSRNWIKSGSVTVSEACHEYWSTHPLDVKDLKWLADYYGRMADDITRRYSL